MQIPECLPCAQQMFSMHLLFRIILQYEADFQPRLLFFFRNKEYITSTDDGYTDE